MILEKDVVCDSSCKQIYTRYFGDNLDIEKIFSDVNLQSKDGVTFAKLIESLLLHYVQLQLAKNEEVIENAEEKD